MVFLGGSGLNAARGGGVAGDEKQVAPGPGLTPRSRSGRPVKRPPHIVGAHSARSGDAGVRDSWFVKPAKIDNGQVQSFTGIVAAPPLPPSEQDFADEGMTPRCDPSGRKYASAGSPAEEAAAGCAGGRMHRPDTCYLTHVYVKQEISYLSHRVDEISRYFLALEQMLGTGMLGPLLQKSSQEVEAKIDAANTLEDVNEIRGLIDAAVRLGFGAERYAPLRDRLHWLEVGKHREDLRRRLAELGQSNAQEHGRQKQGGANAMAAARSAGSPAALAENLQRLIDEATHLGIYPSEMTCARHCLHEAEQLQIDEQMLAAAAKGDVGAIESALRHGADINAQRMEDSASLWHLVADLPSEQGLAIAHLAVRVGADAQLFNSAGHTPLMTAAAGQKEFLVRELLDYGVDPDTRSVSVEQLVECPDKDTVANALAHVNKTTGRVLRRLDVSGHCFDLGDELICGDDLELPIFRRAALRSALHFTIMRAGHEGVEVPVMEALIQRNADINASDEVGCTPLWHAAHAGLVGSAHMLLLRGACVMNTSGMSVLRAAHESYAYATSIGDNALAARSAAAARLLIREGAVDSAGEFFSPGFIADCQVAANFEEAIAMSGGTPEVLAGLQEQSKAYRFRFADRLQIQKARHLTCAAKAADFAAAALPAFQHLLFSLARETGGHARVSRRPTASRLSRMAREAGEATNEAAVDWNRVTGAVHGRLEYHDCSSLCTALIRVKEKAAFRIRGFHDRLLGNNASRDGNGHKSGRCISFMMEVNGAICALHLTVGRVAELEEAQFSEGVWLRSELSSAIQRSSLTEVQQALEHAEAYFGELRLATILRMPLSTDHGSPTGPAGDLQKDTPICAAVRAKQFDIVDLLLDSRASPDTIAADGVTALTLAVQCEDIPCLELLLSSGADPSSIDFDQVEASGSKVEAAHLVMQVLTQRKLDAKALADLVEHFDDTTESLQEALGLLQAGADANTQTSGGGPAGEPMSVLSCATKHGSQRLVRMLLSFKAQVRSTGGGISALQLAKGTPLEAMLTFQACEELQAAVNANDITAIQELLEAGIDPETLFSDAVTHEAKSLLQYAVELPTEIASVRIEDLLRRGADPDRKDGKGRTVLLSCIQAGRPLKIVEILLGYGVDVAATDNEGMTAAMHAAAMGACDILEALLDAGNFNGIDVGSMQDLNGLDAVAHALRSCQVATANILVERGYKANEDAARRQLFEACRRANVGTVYNLLKILSPLYPNLAATTESGEEAVALTNKPTLLMEAVHVQSVEIIEMLVQHGALLYPRCAVGPAAHHISDDDEPVISERPTFQTAWSMSGGHDDIRRALRAGFPQELLMLSRCNDDVAISHLQAEEEHGLIFGPDDFEVVDNEGFGSLDHAVQNGNEELERWYIEHGARLHSPLHIFSALAEPVRIGDAEIVARRLKAGADVHAADDQGRTLLDWSVISGSLSGYVWLCVEYAIQKGEQDLLSTADERHDPEVSSSSGLASLAPSRSVGWGDIEEIELRSPDATAQNLLTPSERHRQYSSRKQGSLSNMSVSHMSMSHKSTHSRGSYGTSVASGSRSGAGHSKRKKHDPTPDPRQTHAAVEQLLVDAGGKFGPEVRSAKYCLWTPMKFRQHETVRRRIRAGADCKVLNEKGASLPHCALDICSPLIAQTLIEFGANPDQTDHRGRSVIWRAVESKHRDLLAACIKMGSDLRQGFGNDNQGSLAHLALETHQPEMATQLLSAGCSPDTLSHGKTVLWRSLELKKPEVARACLQQGADLTVMDTHTGRNLLHLAVESHLDVAEELIKAGVSAKVEDKRGRSALLIASGQGQEAIVEACLEAGARPGHLGGAEAWAALKHDHPRLAEHLIRVAGPSRPRPTTRRSSKQEQRKASAQGGSRLQARRNSLEDKQEHNLLAHAVQTSYREVAVAYIQMSLWGATIVEESAGRLAGSFVDWLCEAMNEEERQNRLMLMEALPATIFEEGTSAAAGDLQKSGAPLPLVQQLARAEIEVAQYSRGSIFAGGGGASQPRRSMLPMEPLSPGQQPRRSMFSVSGSTAQQRIRDSASGNASTSPSPRATSPAAAPAEGRTSPASPRIARGASAASPKQEQVSKSSPELSEENAQVTVKEEDQSYGDDFELPSP